MRPPHTPTHPRTQARTCTWRAYTHGLLARAKTSGPGSWVNATTTPTHHTSQTQLFWLITRFANQHIAPGKGAHWYQVARGLLLNGLGGGQPTVSIVGGDVRQLAQARVCARTRVGLRDTYEPRSWADSLVSLRD